MLRTVLLLSLGAVLYVSGAQAHGVHGDCRYGDSWMGPVMHYHPGGYGHAQPCGGGGPGYGGGGYYQPPPPPPPQYGPGYGGGYYRPGYGGRPGDYGPQTNYRRDCYNYYGQRICCSKGWTVQGGVCKPYRGY